MKHCLDCKYAVWDRTAKGRLHPSGEGKCTYPYKVPELPKSMYWIGGIPPSQCGGYISRKKELKDHCAYYNKEAT
jgi:hypothetical protein